MTAGGLSRPDATITSAQLFGAGRRLSTTGSVQVTRLVRASAVVEALAQARSKGWSPVSAFVLEHVRTFCALERGLGVFVAERSGTS